MNESIGTMILRLRKEHGMTQEQLANALGISFQAVSKWENGISSPDLSTLPLLADLFSVSVDQLLGRQPLEDSDFSNELPAVMAPDPVPDEDYPVSIPVSPHQAKAIREELPWPDDDCFYAVLYHGHELVGYLEADPAMIPAKKHFVFSYQGKAQNIYSDFSVEVKGDVSGSISAGENVSCGDVDGSVDAGQGVKCGDVGRDVNAGTSVNCSDVGGDVRAGGSMRCSDVGGSVCAGGNVSCEDVGGSINAAGLFSGCDLSGKARSWNPYARSSAEGGNDESDWSFNMDGFGEQLGKRISDAVQKAAGFGMKFQKRRQNEQDPDDSEKD